MVRFGRTITTFAVTGALVATAFFSVVAIKASGGEPASLPREVSPEEVSAALSALEADATFQQLTADREWKVVEQVPNMRDGRRIGVGLIVELSSPVDSSGPWTQHRCQGTETNEYAFPYRGVSTLGAAFNGDGALVGLQPLPSPSLAFDDADIAGQPPLPPCPRGREDKEN